MHTVGAYEARTHLSELLRRVEAGERIRITRNGRPVADLVPADPAALDLTDAVVEELLAFGKGHTLGSDLSVKDLIEEGWAPTPRP